MNTKINDIIQCIDDYLIANGLEHIDPVTANQHLEHHSLLKDSKHRAGKPLRELLRAGAIAHAYRAGRFWFIPRSPSASRNTYQKTPTQPSFKTQLAPQPNPAPQTPSELKAAEQNLIHSTAFVPVRNIELLVPKRFGLYCLKIKDVNALPPIYAQVLKQRGHTLFYIGIAETQNLRSRLVDQELRAKGHGTFFRSVGAMLGFLPPQGSLINKANKNNYRFSPQDTRLIIEWMNANLTANWIALGANLKSLEAQLLTRHQPLMNISGNPGKLAILEKARETCRIKANTP